MTAAFLDLLAVARPGMAAIAGSGGKTILMFRLAREAASSGLRVVTTTTTKIFYPTADQTPHVMHAPEFRDLKSGLETALTRHGHVTLIRELLPGGKAAGPDPETLDDLHESGSADLILVEADGSRRLPLKAPGPLEPVIPASTGLVIAVAGLSGLGQPLSEDHVFRADRFAELSGLPLGAPVTREALARVLVHSDGPFRTAPPAAQKAVFLNQADILEPAEAERCARIVAESAGSHLAWTAWGSVLLSEYSVLT